MENPWYITTKGTDIRKITEEAVHSDEWLEIIHRFQEMIEINCARSLFFKKIKEPLAWLRENRIDWVEDQLKFLMYIMTKYPQFLRTPNDLKELFQNQQEEYHSFAGKKDDLLCKVRKVEICHDFDDFMKIQMKKNKLTVDPSIHNKKINMHSWSNFAIKTFYENGGHLLSDSSNKKYLPLVKGLRSCECERCHKDSDKIDLHHVNGNHYDNVLENMLLCCPDCHRILDAQVNREKKIIIFDPRWFTI